MRDETRPPPDWLGDVGDGVDAWTRRAASSTPGDAPDVPPDGSADTAPDDATGSRSDSRGRDRAAGRSRGGSRSGWGESRGRQGGRGGQGSRRSRSDRGDGAPAPVDEVAHGPEADPESVARTILLDQLTGRARSRKELADKLAQKDVPGEIAVRLLDRFEEVGLVDDEAFARTWVSQRQSGKGLAKRALQQELRRKGVDDETTKVVLDEVDPADEEQAARGLVRKKLRSLSRVDDVTATRRLVGMLARKGYSSGLAFSVVKSELAEAGRDAPEDD